MGKASSVLVVSIGISELNASVREPKIAVARLKAESRPLLSVIPTSEPKEEMMESISFAATKELATLRPEETIEFISWAETYELATLSAEETMELRSCAKEAPPRVKGTRATETLIAAKGMQFL